MNFVLFMEFVIEKHTDRKSIYQQINIAAQHCSRNPPLLSPTMFKALLEIYAKLSELFTCNSNPPLHRICVFCNNFVVAGKRRIFLVAARYQMLEYNKNSHIVIISNIFLTGKVVTTDIFLQLQSLLFL